LSGGMPGGATSQLTFLDQQNVVATFFRQMVKKRHAHNAATDYDNPCLAFHDDLHCSVTRIGNSTMCYSQFERNDDLFLTTIYSHSTLCGIHSSLSTAMRE
jgi:hypothetical protein